MSGLIASILSLLSFFLTTTSLTVEKAFLENNSRILHSLFTPGSHIHISLPEPISFSDQLSNEQAFFLFKDLFDSYETFVFYSERPALPPRDLSPILKARWSFRNRKTKKQHVFNVYFFLMSTSSRQRPYSLPWRISEIRAGKI